MAGAVRTTDRVSSIVEGVRCTFYAMEVITNFATQKIDIAEKSPAQIDALVRAEIGKIAENRSTPLSDKQVSEVVLKYYEICKNATLYNGVVSKALTPRERA